MSNTFEEEEWEDEETPQSLLERPTDESISQKYKDSQLRIVRSSVDFTTDHLTLMIKDGEINLSPLYQRRNRWDQKKRSRLIESLLLNIPIPPLFLYESEYGSYEVMDGRQRLEALHDFLSGKFPLKGLEYWTEIEGFFYSDLPRLLQLGLRRRTVGGIILLAETMSKMDSANDIRMVLFERLNTGGIRLNPQELRNALYQGPFNDLILELSSDELFRKIWEIPLDESKGLFDNSLYSSMNDCDIVTRFFAVKDAVLGIRSGSLRQLMDGCAQDYQFIDSEKLKHMRLDFERSLQASYDFLGDSTFRLPATRRLSKSMYDATMVAISLQYSPPTVSLQTFIDDLARAFSNPSTQPLLVGRGNTVQAIRDRVSLMTELLFGVRP